MSTRRTLGVLILLSIFGGVLFLHSLFFGEYGLRDPFLFERPASYLRTEFSACFKTKEFRNNAWRSDCLRTLGDRALASFGVDETLVGLSEIQNDSNIKPYCHAFGHVIGQREFEKTNSLGEAFLTCRKTIACGEGCFHGAVESYLRTFGGNLSKESVDGACNPDDAKNEVTRLACVHGIGHAAMLEYNGDVYASLPVCDYLTKASDKDECYAGVFMEDTFTYGSPNGNSLITPSKPTYPCEEIEERYKRQCYASRSTFVLQSSNSDYEKTSHFCERLPQQYRNVCYGAFGGQAVLQSEDPVYAVAICEAAKRKEDRTQCFMEVMKFKGHSLAGAPEGFRGVCEAVSEENILSCYALAGKEAERWHPNEREAQCKMIAPDTTHFMACVRD